MDKTKNILNNIKPDDLDLSALTMPPFDKEAAWERVRKCDEEIAEYEKKYGDDWWEYYAEDTGFYKEDDYDRDMKRINKAIHCKTYIIGFGSPSRLYELKQKWLKRIKELFGDDYTYDRFFIEDDLDCDTPLLEDALKTGKWKELPDDLQPIYQQKVKNK